MIKIFCYQPRLLVLKKTSKLIIFAVIFILTSCSSTPAPIVEGWHQSPANRSEYIVQKGDTLYSIAWAFALDFRDLARFNHLSPPYKLHAGQKLNMTSTLPPIKYAITPLPRFIRSPRAALPKPGVVKKVAISKKSITYQRITPGKISKSDGWVWPAQGKVVKGFSMNSGGNRGIEIAGRRGEPIIATAPGKVVYAGSGLRGYGNLIIIKHNDTYLSAYAYNKILLVKEGMSVKAGQKIALMGSNNAGQTRVHFEIRRNGKPVNPIKFLL